MASDTVTVDGLRYIRVDGCWYARPEGAPWRIPQDDDKSRMLTRIAELEATPAVGAAGVAVARVEAYGFECQGGYLVNCTDWHTVKALLGDVAHQSVGEAKAVEARPLYGNALLRALRAHPSAGVVTEAMVEAAAIRLCEVMAADSVCHDEDGKPNFALWNDATKTARNEWRNQAHEVLIAALTLPTSEGRAE